jgi:dienelactone hydrolase
MKYSLFTLLLTFCFPVFAQSAATTGNHLVYQVDGAAYEGYYVSPRPDAPLVFLIHDWDGLTGYETHRADMLAALGYAVFAPDLFGAGVRPTEVEDKRQHTGELFRDRQKMRALLDGALAAARASGAETDNAVAMGYCFGGAAVLELARAGAGFKGYVTFHGGLNTPAGQDYGETDGRVLVMHGTADTAVTMDDFKALALDLEASSVPHEMITYGGAPHAFTVFNTDKYREDADRKSWQRFQEFLKNTLK